MQDDFEAAKADLQNAKAVARHGAWVVFDDTCFSPLRAVWSEALEAQLVEPPSESITFCPTNRHGIARLGGCEILWNTHKLRAFLYVYIYIYIYIYLFIYLLHLFNYLITYVFLVFNINMYIYILYIAQTESSFKS